MATIAEALDIAVRHHQGGRLAQAEQVYQQILRVEPHQPDALHLLGVVHSQRGSYQTAIDYIGRAIRLKPNEAVFHSNLGLAYRESGQLDEALASLRRSVELRPDFVDAHHNLGLTFKQQGVLEEAIASYRRALQIQPLHANVLSSLGNALQAEGKLDDAMACYRQALEIQPGFVQAHTNLGACLRAQGKLAEAVACYRRAIEIKPDYAQAHHNLGNALKTGGMLEEAAAAYQRAISLKPGYAQAHNSLGNVFKDQDKIDEAAACYRRALELEPEQPLLELRLSTLCPVVFFGNEQIDEFRRQLLSRWTRLAEGDLRLDLAELAVSGSEPPLGLQYHGRDDRPLKEAYATIFRNAFPQATPRPGTGRPRIGFVVTGRHEAAFLGSMGGVLRHMTPDRFELVVICQPIGRAAVGEAIPEESIRILVVPERLDLIAQMVRAAEFDVLYHWEVGTDATNYFLPFLRLAPVQCTSWGVPETSGIGQIDYYLSSALVEPEEADEHYTERLLLARTLPAYHQRVSPPDELKGREAFGFAAEEHLYLCAQKLQKLHPDFDGILAGILRRDDRGLIVLVEDRHGQVAAKLRERFAATVTDVAERVVFLARQSYADYLSLLAACDVVLDPLYFGGGFTTYQAFSLDKPIVTLPWRFQRGRYTQACYRKMGITDGVAASPEEYIDMAVGLGSDEDRRAAVVDKIRTASVRLFEDMEAVREHERLFVQMVDEARSGPAS